MSNSTTEITVWDLFIRIFHWSVATLFLLDFWVLEEGDPPHEWAGYVIGFLLIARLIWGFIGSPNARFATFFPTPARLRHHLSELRAGKIDLSEGHNPLGGAMILLLLALLAAIVMTGWMLTWDAFWGEGWLEDLHEILADITMGAVVIHISAVVIMGWRYNIPLIKTMLTGKRNIPS